MIVSGASTAIGTWSRIYQIKMNLFRKLANIFGTSPIVRNYHVVPVPALKDNYMYAVINVEDNTALAVDPVEPEKLLTALGDTNIKLTSVLTTHHHSDHDGGNLKIASLFPDIPIIGGDSRITKLTKKVGHGEILTLGSFRINCLLTACHTSGHMSYYMESKDSRNACFTGDTLFVGGCGRFFEGTAKDMITALNTLSNLPDQTLIYCGHEYTVNNLKFAVHVEPSNKISSGKLDWAIQRRSSNLATVPSTLGDEKSFNPFLRLTQPEVKVFCNSEDPVEIMSILRHRKDNFIPA